jgi:DNA-binding GntR family transcriptional regulator
LLGFYLLSVTKHTMSSSVPIPRQSLHDELLTRIRSLIIDGDLCPGAKVAERELCNRFSVSRTPLREALKVLAAEGLVRLPPNRGAIISEIRIDDLEDCFQVLAELEALAAELCCTRMTNGEIKSARILHERMRAEHTSQDLPAYHRLNRQLHDSIITSARNRVLADQHQRLALRVRRTQLVTRISRARWDAAMREHDAIIERLEARAAQELAQVMRAHILQVRDYYRTILPRGRSRKG